MKSRHVSASNKFPGMPSRFYLVVSFVTIIFTIYVHNTRA